MLRDFRLEFYYKLPYKTEEFIRTWVAAIEYGPPLTADAGLVYLVGIRVWRFTLNFTATVEEEVYPC